MRKWLVVGALGAIATVQLACSSDDPVVGAPTGQGGSGGAGGAGGKAGTGGTGGTAGSKASGAGGVAGAAGASGAAGTGNGGGGAGGAAGAGGDGGMGGAGGTNVVDPCAGKYSPLPLVVSSAFTNLRICSSGTCTAPAMPYYFAPIPNPNCDEAFPDGGIVPPFAEAGVDGATDPDAGDVGSDGSDAAPLPVADASDAGAADAGSTDAGVTADAGADADAGANSADVTAAVDAVGSGDAPADVSMGTEAGAEASREAASGDGGAPSCYEFLYNPACTTGTCWGGVIFTQSAGGNADPGVCVESGATKISFKAKASRANARIKFGSIREGLGATEFFMNITTEWATYEVSIPAGEPYNNYSAGGTGVWNGFSVIVEPQDHPGGTYIFVKDAVWMK